MRTSGLTAQPPPPPEPAVEPEPVVEPESVAAEPVTSRMVGVHEVDAASGELAVEVDDPDGPPVRFVKRDGNWSIKRPADAPRALLERGARGLFMPCRPRYPYVYRD